MATKKAKDKAVKKVAKAVRKAMQKGEDEFVLLRCHSALVIGAGEESLLNHSF